MKNLERAFGNTPEYVASAIRAGIAKGQRRALWRRRMYAATSAAAMLAVLVGGLTFAVRRQAAPTKPGQPPVLSSVSATPTPTLEPTPMSSALPTPTSSALPTPTSSALPMPTEPPTPQPTGIPTPISVAEEIESPREVFAGAAGSYYHDIGDCSGLRYAVSMTEEEAIGAGKRLCPICEARRAESLAQRVFWSTAGGTYYHTDPNCSGMRGAALRGQAQIQKLGQKPCPVCIGIGSLQIRGAWWDGEYMLLCYDVALDDSFYVFSELGARKPEEMSEMAEASEAGEALRAILTDAEYQTAAARIEKGGSLYLEHTNVEITTPLPIAKRVFRGETGARTYAMYPVSSRADMRCQARISTYAYALNTDGTLYGNSFNHRSIALEGDAGIYRLRGDGGMFDLSSLVNAWPQRQQVSGIAYGSGEITLQSLGGAFEGMVLLEYEMPFDSLTADALLSIDGGSIPLTARMNGSDAERIVRALLTADEAEKLSEAPELFQLRKEDMPSAALNALPEGG